MAKKVVADGGKPTAKKQRVIEEEQRNAEEKIEFSMEFTPSEEKAWINEERCNTVVLFFSILLALIVGTIAAFISNAMGHNATSAAIDTAIVFVVGLLIPKISEPLIKIYVRKHYSEAAAAGASGKMISGRAYAGAIFFYLTMALGTCIVVLSIL